MLSPYRVLDLLDERGEIAGMMLADLGADVIKVEPPHGAASRRQGPRLADGPEAERSLSFFAYNRNKRSIALDLASERQTFLELVRSADFLLESGPRDPEGSPGELPALAFEELRAVNPQLVHVRLTPFGVDGPHAAHPASDLTIAALGGPMSLQGVPERAPVRVSVPQVWRHAGAETAVAALVAHERRLRSGRAQFVDVSAQCAMTWTMLNAMSAFAIQGKDFNRSGSMLQLGVLTLPLVFPAADGHVVLVPSGNQAGKMVHWLIEDGIVPAAWADEDWDGFERRLLAGEKMRYAPLEVLGAIGRFTANHKKTDLLERGMAESVTIAPVNTIPDLLAFRHLESRGFFERVELPNGQTALAPGAFARRADAGDGPGHPSDPSRGGVFRRPAPHLDEHAAEIRAELASVPREPAGPRRARSPSSGADADLPFAGLKVADFSWIGVGPISAKYLADHGADVIRVESETRPDNLRGAGPFKDELPGWDRSHFFGEFNTSKRGLALDLKQPVAKQLARRLIAWADVFIESFAPGAVERLGLDYASVRQQNPGLVMMSTCLMGQTGPAAKLAGYGYHAGAVAGFYEVTGWPDLAPSGPWMAYTDTIAPRFVASTLIAALDQRRRTGEGCHIDGAQLEMGLQFLAPEILDYQLSGRAASRSGNRLPDAAPQGVYPCAGDDQWCAIAVDDDRHWQALRRALGDPDWARAPELATLPGRLRRHDEIDAELSAWTRELEAREVMRRLIEAGVPAGVVQRSSDLLRDPQYAHRRFYTELEHAEIGRVPYAGHQFRIEGHANAPRFAAPKLGEHSFEILRDVLGLSDDEVAEAVASGAIT